MTAFDWHADEFARLAGARETLPHALLIHVARGIGKLAFAQALSQSLLCESPKAGGMACGACPSCLWFAAGTHPDHRLVEREAPKETDPEEGGRRKRPRTEIIVDQVRALSELVNLSSHRGNAKTIVIHPAEDLNVNAANALLKNLEEPPPRTYFLLVSHRPHQLLPTIRSRCRMVPLPVPHERDITAWLAAQGVKEPDVALAYAGGAPLLALELQEGEYWGARTAFLRALGSERFEPLSTAEAVQNIPVLHVLSWLQKWSYDVAHHQALGRVRYNPDHAQAIARAAASAQPLAMLRFHREMVQLQAVAEHPLNERLLFEQVLLAYRDALGRAPAYA